MISSGSTNLNEIGVSAGRVMSRLPVKPAPPVPAAAPISPPIIAPLPPPVAPDPEPEPEPEPVFAGASSRTSYAAELEHTLGGRVIGSQLPPYSPPAFSAPPSQTASPSLTPWVSAPATEPERMSSPSASIPPRPSVSTWLQAPIRKSGVSPWRKVVRWLQAPARS